MGCADALRCVALQYTYKHSSISEKVCLSPSIAFTVTEARYFYLSSPSKQFSLAPSPAQWGTPLLFDDREADDDLHNPDAAKDRELDKKFNVSSRGVVNLGFLTVLIVGLLMLLYALNSITPLPSLLISNIAPDTPLSRMCDTTARRRKVDSIWAVSTLLDKYPRYQATTVSSTRIRRKRPIPLKATSLGRKWCWSSLMSLNKKEEHSTLETTHIGRQ